MKVENANDLECNLEICKAVLGEVSPSASWSEIEQKETLGMIILQSENVCMQIKRSTYELQNECNEEVFRLPSRELLEKFQEPYQTVLGRLKGGYKQNKEQIRNVYLNLPKDLSDEDIIELLQKLCELQEARRWLQEKRSFLVERIEAYYRGENTNWILLKEDMKQFDKVCSFFSTPGQAYEAITEAGKSREYV